MESLEEIKIYKNLQDDFKKYFLIHPELLPEGVVLENVDITGSDIELPVIGETPKPNWEVIFNGYLGEPEWVEYYDLTFDGIVLIDVKKSSDKTI